MIGGPSEYPEPWAFLESLHRGAFLSGTVAAIERGDEITVVVTEIDRERRRLLLRRLRDVERLFP